MTNLRHLLSSFFLAQAVALILGTLVTGLIGGQFVALSFAAGTVIMTATILGVGLVGWRVFAQKSVAWTIFGIISKYAITLGGTYALMKTRWFSIGAGGLGICSVILTALAVVALTEQKE